MFESRDKLDEGTSLGVFMAFGAGVGGGVGYLVGFLLENALLWWPIGVGVGLSLGVALWFGRSD